jgi:ferredoxin-NADP reductase
MNPLNFIDILLNKVTMYRLMVYGLAGISFISLILALTGRLPMDALHMVLSAGILGVSCLVTEFLMAKIWGRPFNHESWLITAMIIFLIFPMANTVVGALTLGVVGGVSSASKFLISWRGKHIFNPAAFAVGLVGILNIETASWWVGSSALWPFTLIFGLLVVRKIRRFSLMITFAIIAIGLQVITFAVTGVPVWSNLGSILTASPLIFLGTIMLTEPATMPPRRSLQVAFAAIVAVLYVEAWKVGPVYIYPEIALLIGNIFAFIVSPKFKESLILKEVQRISERVYNFVFIPSNRFAFEAGQYMEWTLPHVGFDARGNRRSFTIASSPTEETVQLGVKFYNPSSTYKYRLSQMQPGDEIFVSQLAGNFTLRGKAGKKLVFIAGGIGITPFRSMIKNVIDVQERVDITLIYVVGSAEELAYKELFTEAVRHGVKFVPIVTNANSKDGYRHGQLDANLLKEVIPDSPDRVFYISGPNAMVDRTKHELGKLGVRRRSIKTDHFAGY